MGIKKEIQQRLDEGRVLTGKDVMMLFHGRYSAVTRLRETAHSSFPHPSGDYRLYFRKSTLGPFRKVRPGQWNNFPFVINQIDEGFSVSCGKIFLRNCQSLSVSKTYIRTNYKA